MISDALEFLHARKWLVELLLLLAIAGAIWWGCNHLIGVGVQRQKDDDAKALVELQHKADIETGRLQGLADRAEHAHDEELTDLRTYRANNELHFSVCVKSRGSGNLPQTTSTDKGHAGSTSTPVMGEPVSTPDPDIIEDRGPLLDAFAALFDDTNGTVREWQARQ